MAITHDPVFVQNPKLALAKIAPADTTTLKTVVTAGANGSKVLDISVVDAGGDAPTVRVYVTRSAVDYRIGAVVVPVNSGLAGVVTSCDILGALISANRSFPLPVDNDGQPYLFLESGDILKMSVAVTLSTGDLNIKANYGDF